MVATESSQTRDRRVFTDVSLELPRYLFLSSHPATRQQLLGFQQTSAAVHSTLHT
jgi:hypothetical protein